VEVKRKPALVRDQALATTVEAEEPKSWDPSWGRWRMLRPDD
jgi:hypothetical protein